MSDDGEMGVGDWINIMQGESTQGTFGSDCSHLVKGGRVFEKWRRKWHVLRIPCTCSSNQVFSLYSVLGIVNLFHIRENWGSEKCPESCN